MPSKSVEWDFGYLPCTFERLFDGRYLASVISGQQNKPFGIPCSPGMSIQGMTLSLNVRCQMSEPVGGGLGMTISTGHANTQYSERTYKTRIIIQSLEKVSLVDICIGHLS